ncbi:hypothetical protein COOONC_10904 [Cooperia oncophora]
MGNGHFQFYYYRSDFNETHAAEWRRTQEECRCQMTMTTTKARSLNCYPRSIIADATNATADSLRCGECFSCISMPMASGERYDRILNSALSLDTGNIQHKPNFRKAQMVFAFSSDHTAVNKLLVLIGSVHKHYPSTKVLLYDTEVGSDLLQKKLVSVRNVIVNSADVAMKHLSDDADKSQMNALFMWDALSRYRSVLWMNDDLEFLSRNLDDILNKTTSAITAIGREYSVSTRKHGTSSIICHVLSWEKKNTAFTTRITRYFCCEEEPERRFNGESSFGLGKGRGWGVIHLMPLHHESITRSQSEHCQWAE